MRSSSDHTVDSRQSEPLRAGGSEASHPHLERVVAQQEVQPVETSLQQGNLNLIFMCFKKVSVHPCWFFTSTAD